MISSKMKETCSIVPYCTPQKSRYFYIFFINARIPLPQTIDLTLFKVELLFRKQIFLPCIAFWLGQQHHFKLLKVFDCFFTIVRLESKENSYKIIHHCMLSKRQLFQKILSIFDVRAKTEIKSPNYCLTLFEVGLFGLLHPSRIISVVSRWIHFQAKLLITSSIAPITCVK